MWVPNALSLVQAVGGPIIAFASDTFQARKTMLWTTCTVSFIGAAIAPGAKDIYRVIVAQVLIGVGFAAVPLAYSIPSEILPRRWRPLTQAGINLAAGLAAVSGPAIAGALVKRNAHTGWRNFFWFQMAMWGVTAAVIFVGYNPPKRHTRVEHLSLGGKIATLDLPGMGLLTAGLTLLLTGLTLGGSPWSWANARVVATLVVGCVLLVAFGVYEKFGTKTGVLHHELFKRRTFGLCIGLIFIEGIMLFSIIVFYPVLTGLLFEKDPLLAAVRTSPFWLGSLTTIGYGYWSMRYRTIRGPLITGFAIFTAGIVGLATVQPGQSLRALVFDCLGGMGFGAPLILIIAAVQLCTPHHLIATATAVVTSSRAVAASTFTAIYGAAMGSSMKVKMPGYVAAAAIVAGLPPQYVAPFVGALLGDEDPTAVPSVTPEIIAAAAAAIPHAQADSLRLVFIIAAPFGVLACIMAWFIDDLSAVMNYRVDAPVEKLEARHAAHGEEVA